jgi:uncharacterized protein with PIN domain
MIVDPSALVAILEQEADAERIAQTLASTSERMLSGANLGSKLINFCALRIRS